MAPASVGPTIADSFIEELQAFYIGGNPTIVG
jgi:hypothetical protein